MIKEALTGHRRVSKSNQTQLDFWKWMGNGQRHFVALSHLNHLMSHFNHPIYTLSLKLAQFNQNGARIAV